MPKKEEKVLEETTNLEVEQTESSVNSDIADELSLENNNVIDSATEESFNADLQLDSAGDSLSTEHDEEEIPVTVQPVKFSSFEDLSSTQGEINKNLDILMDIKLQLTVELGRTELPIRKVLELTRGSIIELEKVAGEPVELYANGKLVAHGEVVVIEDNFGLRITSITDPEDRIKGIGS